MSRYPEFRDSVFLVTGGAGGIGRGVVTAIKREHGIVASLDLATNAEADLSIQCDVTDEDAITGAIDRVQRELGSISYVITSAGIVKEHPFESLETSSWQKVMDVSLTSTFYTIRAAVAGMVDQGGGSIVTMSSGWGRKGYPFGADYAAAKSGIEALTKSVALEFASRGVRANSIAPGPIRTAMIRDNPAFDEEGKARAIPMGRVGEVDEVVPGILFLLSDDARYITGQVLHINGGLLMP
jgi:NAD(P)-dependent dehydrogenase (short-subunit alcohol dehydrogenase family)